MTTQEITEHNVIEQLDSTVRALHVERENLLRNCVILCTRISTLPVLTRNLSLQIEEGQPHEALESGVAEMHTYFSELAKNAEQICSQFRSS